jgi:hypothetical protein
MIMKDLRRITLIIVGMAVVLLAGCATGPTKQPIFLHPEFDPKNVESITILPILDRRIDKSLETDINETGKDAIKDMLEAKKYDVNVTKEIGNESIMNMTLKAINEADTSWSKRLGPSNSKWVFLAIVKKIDRDFGFHVSAEAEVVGYLYDKSTGERVWKDDGQGSHAMGYFFAATVDDGALQMAVFNMLQSFPKK